MKNVFGIIAILFLLSSCGGEKRTDWKFHNLKGKVAEFTERTYGVVETDGKIEQNDQLFKQQKTFKFNAEGKYLEQIILDDKGELEYRSKYIIEDGITVRSESYFEEEKLGGRNEFENKDGKIIGGKEYDEKGNLKSYTKIFYDQNLVNRIETYDEKDKLTFKSENKIKNGKIIETQQSFKNVDMKITTKFEFNQDGHHSKITSIQNNDEFLKQVEYEYTDIDEQGNWTKRITNSMGDAFEINVREIKYH